MNLSYFIAKRYLVKQKGAFSAFIIRLSIVATALSVAVMILAVAFITGFKHSITEKLYSFMGHVHIELYDPTNSNTATLNPIKADPNFEAQILKVQHVVHIFPFAQRPVIVQANGQMEGLTLKGVTKKYQFLKGITVTGKGIDYSDSSYSKQVLLSSSTASRLNIGIGDSVQIYFLEPGATPRIRRVKVSGLYHSGMEDIDKAFGVCDIRLLQRINNWQPDDINSYQIDLDDARYSDTVSDYIFDTYLHDPKNPLHVYTIRDVYPQVFEWLDLQDVNGPIILAIMGIVAIINLATALIILIVEQVRMIGILKTLGMTLGKMRKIFLYHAGLIAGMGILLGNIIAIVFCKLQEHYGFMKLNEETYSMKEVPIGLVWWHVATIDGVTLLLCILCMWLPTLYIRRINPARALQFK